MVVEEDKVMGVMEKDEVMEGDEVMEEDKDEVMEKDMFSFGCH